MSSCSKSGAAGVVDSWSTNTMDTKSGIKPFSFPDLDWSKFDSYPEKVAALQVPEDILHTMTSIELAEIVYDYPFLIHGLAYNDYLFGVGRVLDRFNAYEELCQRDDAFAALLTIFKERFPTKIVMSKLPRESVVRYSVNMRLWACVLCQNAVVPVGSAHALESLSRVADDLKDSIVGIEELHDLSIMSIPIILEEYINSRR